MGLKAAGMDQNENVGQSKGQVARVISLSENKATVKVQRHTSCEKCGACNLGMVSSTEKTVEVENTLNAREGDLVMLGIKSGAILSASFILYIIPLLTFFGGLVAGNRWGEEFGISPDIFSVILGTTFLILTFIIIYIYDKRIRNTTNKFRPYITRIVSEDEAKELIGEKALNNSTSQEAPNE